MGLLFRNLQCALLLGILCLTAQGQVSINLSVKPPFTPFLSDYTNPSRLEDISLSMFNQSGEEVRLKFQFTLKNQAKGIEISLKETTIPKEPLVLSINEFQFVTMDEISKVYGKLSQSSFNIIGADVQNLILDGTIPDGLYEFCIQAFDYDAPGFSKPLSGNSPQGCFTFRVNYTDPPTDIRFSNNILNYQFGGEIPKIGINNAGGQNYTVQFTPPAFNLGSEYEYELFVFDNQLINPNRQRESQLLEAINTLTPTIHKTASVPFFTIDGGDIELDFNKDYFLLVRATDLNSQALFKNKGFSTFKAFNMVNITPLMCGAPDVNAFSKCGKIIQKDAPIKTLSWENDFPGNFPFVQTKNIQTRIRIVQIQKDVITPTDVFAFSSGTVVFDSILVKIDGFPSSSFDLPDRLNTINKDQTKWIVGVQHKVIPNRPFTSHIQFQNDGKGQCEIEFNFSTQQKIEAPFVIKPVYPIDNDTLPFHYPPVVFDTKQLRSSDRVVFTQFNSRLEPLEVFKIIKTTTDPEINTEINLLSIDTVMNKVARFLNQAALVQQSYGGDAQFEINGAKELLHNSQSLYKSQITTAYSGRYFPMGNTSDGMMALANNVMKYNATNQLITGDPDITFPNISKMLYLMPFKNNILWTGRIGIYNNTPSVNEGNYLFINEYQLRFVENSFSPEELQSTMLKEGFKTGNGMFHTGMKTPRIISTTIDTIHFDSTKSTYKTKVTLNFIPSDKPVKLLPPRDSNEVWNQFKFVSVAQQWNIEISPTKDFVKLDTVLSKRIIKNYNIAAGEQPIIADLYAPVKQIIQVYDTGKYYWRVTWSNITLDENAPEPTKAYFRNLGNLLATSQLIGEQITFDSFFLNRINYKISKVDSFYIKPNKSAINIAVPNFSVVYPVEGDTIPFYYPPVVIQKSPLDSNYLFALTKFNSTVEPFQNHNYFIFDSLHPSSRKLHDLSFDSASTRIQNLFDQMAQQQLETGVSNAPNEDPAVLELFSSQEKHTHLVLHNTPRPQNLPLGNSAQGKQNLARLISDRKAFYQVSAIESDAAQLETPSVKGLVYLVPYKNIGWHANIAYYTNHGTPQTPVDSFEKMFLDKTLNTGAQISPENKQGLAVLSGNFSVGMRTPELLRPYHGGNVSKDKIEIIFRPSLAPKKLLPSFEMNPLWDNWRKLYIAQQWNIEVSESKSFDTLVLVHSNALIKEYKVPDAVGTINHDLYLSTTRKIDLPAGKKYYYRITWSNPSEGDSTNQFHKDYFSTQAGFLATGMDANEEFDTAQLHNFANFNRVNYKFSAVDSFFVTDSSSIKDTAVCGLDCTFSMNGVNSTPFVGHVQIGDSIAVGNFKMKVKTVTANVTARTYTGTGTIKTDIFGAPIAVKFTGIQVSSEKRLVGGTVVAQRKEADLFNRLQTGTNTGFSLFDNFKREMTNRGNLAARTANPLVSEIYDFINGPTCLLLDHLMGNEIKLPFGLSKEVDNFPYTISITDINFTPTGASFNVASIVRFEIGGYEQYLGFGAEGLCLTPKGIGDLTSNGSLELLGSIDIPLDGNKLRILGREIDTVGAFGNSGTRMVWDCKGFKHIDLKVSMEVDTSIMHAVINGLPVRDKKVVATGHTVVSSLSNWLLAIDFDTTFEVNILKGYTFKCRQASIDLSDYANPQGMVFPRNYIGDKSNNWKGVYFKELQLKLPDWQKDLLKFPAPHLIVENTILDHSGITLKISVLNLLPDVGMAIAGWKYTWDTLSLQMVNTRLTEFKWVGKIGIPIFDSTIKYSVLVNPNPKLDSIGLNFTLKPDAEMVMPAWFASVRLAPTSTIFVTGNQFDVNSMKLNCNLNGEIDIGADEIAGLKDVRFGTLPFEGLKVSTAFTTLDSFKLKLDRLGGLDMNRVIRDNQNASGIVSSGTQKTGGFNINIQDFAVDAFVGKCNLDLMANDPGLRIGVKFKVIVNVASVGTGSIGGMCKLGIYAAPKNLENAWEFLPCGINVDTIQIFAQLNGVVKIEGGIIFRSNDPVYGNGVAGRVAVDIAKMMRIDVAVMFGEIDGMQYWMLGAEIGNLPPIPIDFSVGVLYANSFSGEGWYRMERIPGTAADVGSTAIGRSPSGANFIPDRTKLFGFGASIGLTGPPGTPLFGNIGLYADINVDGGLSKLTITGNLWMTENNKATAPVLVNANITVDVDRKRLLGDMTAVVNVGNGAVRGRKAISTPSGMMYQAGSVNVLIDYNRNEWYIKMGDPFKTDGKMGFTFYAGNDSIFSAGGYFMMGNKLPQSLPPIDPELAVKLNNLGISAPRQSNRNNALGLAVLMGVDANIPEKKVEMGMFFAGVSMHFAADGILSQNAPSCPNRNGLQNWYMTGKAYGVANGAIGMHVDMPIYKGDVIFATLNAGMVLDAGLLNPYYFSGNLSVNYSLFGGLIDGNTRLRFELSEDVNCAPPVFPDKLSFGQLVADINPANQATEILVGAEPSIVLNFAYKKETTFEIPEMRQVSPGVNVMVKVTKKIRVNSEYITMKNMRNNREVSTSIWTNNDDFQINIRPDSFLQDRRNPYQIKAKFYIEQYNATLNKWETIKRSNGSNWDTIVTYQFSTENEASFQMDYVDYTTPLQGENFFKPYNGNVKIGGKVVCSRNDVQSRFFNGTLPSSGSLREVALVNGYNKYYAQIAVAGDPSATIDLPISFNSNIISFTLPDNLNSDNLYQIRIIKERIPGRGLANTSTNSRTVQGINIKQRKVEVQVDGRLIMYSFCFKVSKYRTIEEKIQQLNLSTSSYAFSANASTVVEAETAEPFEAYEVAGYQSSNNSNVRISPPLVVTCSNNEVDRNSWMTTFYLNKVYNPGRTLQAKGRQYTGSFTDLSRQISGVSIVSNNHIFSPLPQPTGLQFDLRIADIGLTNLSRGILNHGNLAQNLGAVSASFDGGLTMDPRTGKIGESGQLASGRVVENKQTTKPPALGSIINFDYAYILNMGLDFNRLKTLATSLRNRRLNPWYTGLNSTEIALVEQVRSSNYVFELPVNSILFAIALHKNSANVSPAAKLQIKSTILAPLPVATASRTSSTFSRLK